LFSVSVETSGMTYLVSLRLWFAAIYVSTLKPRRALKQALPVRAKIAAHDGR
jgi:hypothetical protein